MKAFQIPKIEEVIQFIQNKKPHWPGSFVEWIAGKFWYHYQSCGWKLSSSVAMKDWHAAFCSRWQDLPYEEQKRKLQECLKEDLQKPKTEPHFNMLDDIDGLFNDFKNGKINRDKMSEVYKWLKVQVPPWWTKEELNTIVSDSGNDKNYGRYLAIKLLFQKIIACKLSFTDYFEGKPA